MSAKSPAFEVIRHDGSFEVRRYDGYLTANVRVRAAGYSDAVNVGFNPLADYIFGNNHESSRIAMTVPVSASHSEGQKIDMTAPVSSQRTGGQDIPMTTPATATRSAEEYVVSFTMPAQLSMDDLPLPNNPMVVLESVEPHTVAVASFSGYLSEKGFAKALGDLTDWIAEQGLVPIGEPFSAQYDAPWKPGFVRHNEALITVDPQSPGLT